MHFKRQVLWRLGILKFCRCYKCCTFHFSTGLYLFWTARTGRSLRKILCFYSISFYFYLSSGLHLKRRGKRCRMRSRKEFFYFLSFYISICLIVFLKLFYFCFLSPQNCILFERQGGWSWIVKFSSHTLNYVVLLILINTFLERQKNHLVLLKM